MNFLILSIIKAAVVAFVLLTALAYLQWLERKVLAHIQLRVGPRRVGPHGLLQPLADVIKLITKEDMMPSHVNKVFWFLAPFIAVLFFLGFFGGNFATFSLWLPEQYPTAVRATAFAFATSFGRFIGAGANFLIGAAVHRYGTLGTPVAVTSLAFLIGLLLIPWAMETKGMRLPD